MFNQFSRSSTGDSIGRDVQVPSFHGYAEACPDCSCKARTNMCVAVQQIRHKASSWRTQQQSAGARDHPRAIKRQLKIDGMI